MLEVVRQIAADNRADPWLDELKAEWHLQATSGFGFGPTPNLDYFLTTDYRKQQLAHYFRKTLEFLSKRCRGFTPDELDQSGVGGKGVIYSQELPTQMVIGVGREFLGLLTAGAETD
jgi:hypothetical protein